MATITANGNASVMSRAYRTDDGYFEHAVNGLPKKESKPMIFGPTTVYDANGEAWESAYWMWKGEHPVPNPVKGSKKKWVSKEFAENYIRKQKEINKYGGNDTYNSTTPSAGTIDPGKMASIRTSYNTSKAVSGAINKVTGAPGKFTNSVKNAAKNSDWGKAASRAMAEYDVKNTAFAYDPKYDMNGQNVTPVYRGNAAGRALAGTKAVLGQEGKNMKKGGDAAVLEYQRNHAKTDMINGAPVRTYDSNSLRNKVGEKMAYAKGAIGASAVGRAGKAAFNALKNKAIAAKEDFTKAIEKYLSGDNAKANRSQVLSELQTKAGNLISAVGRAFGTSEGRKGMLGTLTGTATGVASGIAKSNIGKVAIGAGKAAYGAVKDKVGNVLDAISNFFKQKKIHKELSPSSVGA